MSRHVEGQFVFNAALLADLAQDVVAMAVARHIKHGCRAADPRISR